MPQPAEIEEFERPLVDAYRRAGANIRAEMQQLADDPLRATRKARLAEMLERIDDELDDLVGQSRLWTARSLPGVYALGGADGLAQLGKVGEFVWSEIHTEAVQRLATGLFKDLLAATKHVRNDTKRLIRDVARDRALQKAIEGKTARQAGVEMRRVLEKRGINAVTYKNGARHAIGEYSQMAIRTTTAIAYNEGTVNGATSEGIKYFEVFDGPECGWSYHGDPDLALGKIVSREEALAFSISHPNCRRAFGPRPDVLTKKQAKDADRSVTEDQTADQRLADETGHSRKGERRLQSERRDGELENGRLKQIEAALEDAQARLKRAPGGRARSKIKGEIEALRRELDDLLRVVPDPPLPDPPRPPPLPPRPIDPPKPPLPPGDYPSVEEILKQHFGWTRKRALREQYEVRLRQVPDNDMIRKAHPGWTRARAEKERQALIDGLAREYKDIVVKPLPKPPKPDPLPPGPPVVVPPTPDITRVIDALDRSIASLRQRLRTVTSPTARARLERELEAAIKRRDDLVNGVQPKPPPRKLTAAEKRAVADLEKQIGYLRQGGETDPRVLARIASIQARIDQIRNPPAPPRPIRDRIADVRARYESQLGVGQAQFTTADVSELNGMLRSVTMGSSGTAQAIRDLPWLKDVAIKDSFGQPRWTRQIVKDLSDSRQSELRDWLLKQQLPGSWNAKALQAMGVPPVNVDKLLLRSTDERVASGKVMTIGTNRTAGKAAETVIPGLAFYYRYMDPKVLGRLKPGGRRVNFDQNKTGRAFYQPWSQTVSTTASVRTTVHEVGHHMENQMPGWRQAAIEWREARSKVSPKGHRLTTIYKGTKEVGYEDEFYEHYVGRYYGAGRDTEVVSMGMEMMYADPGRLLAADPEHFWLMVGLLKGELP